MNVGLAAAQMFEYDIDDEALVGMRQAEQKQLQRSQQPVDDVEIVNQGIGIVLYLLDGDCRGVTHFPFCKNKDND